MKRSVILMGGKTFVVSLPANWVKKYGIQKGEELELEEIDNTVVVRTGKIARGDELNVNFSSLNKMLGRSIGAIYKAGYEQVKIIYNGYEQLRIIEDILHRTCIGFEIIRQEESYIVVKSLVQTDPQEFSNSLKRLFYSLEVMGQD
ncbi:MAG: AbrB/MazE/SpoVT family DNA-binding domain-containing protein, partial [Nanoarchaeota archaeon]|nr:AbrB/MazE/SpoVT family DNA-binding domain-containing protein [Nanoarchaeota archaeon]